MAVTIAIRIAPGRCRRRHRGAILAAMEPQFVRFDDVAPFTLVEGVEGRPLFGDGAMINLIEFERARRCRRTAIRTSSSGSCCAGCRRSSSTASPASSGPMEGYVLPGDVEHSAYCGPGGRHRDRRLLPGARGLSGAMGRLPPPTRSRGRTAGPQGIWQVPERFNFTRDVVEVARRRPAPGRR